MQIIADNIGMPLRIPPKLILIMKITTFILIVALAQVYAKGFGQKITLNTKNTPIEKVLQSIREQSGYSIVYNIKDLKDEKVSLQLNSVSIEEAVAALIKDLPLTYEIVKKNIVLSRKAPSLLDKLASVIQSVTKDLTVRGVVKDQDGKPLPNASIRVKGKSAVTNTNQNGEFEIKNVADDAVLLISFVGFRTLELPLKDALMPLEIKLNVATGELEEVKVVYNTGYQELNKERATGSFVQIDNELFNRSVGANVLDRIKDLVPGIYSTGQISNNSLDEFTIRGVSTFSASKRPLLVIDNFIYDGDPNSINPNDVESVTVLRDAAAASIWGVRSGNGVIVITMKKGKPNSRPVVSFGSNISLTEKDDLFAIPIVSSKDVVALEKQRFEKGFYDSSINNITNYPVIPQVAEILVAKREGRISATMADAELALLEGHDIRNDVNKYLRQIPIAQQYSLNISGGANAFQYYGSVGYNRARPTNINVLNEALSLRFSNTWQPVKNLRISAGINWNQANSIDKNSLGGYSNILTSPYHRLADEQGNALAIAKTYRLAYVDTVKFPGQLDWHYRPLDEAWNGDRRVQSYNTIVNGEISYTIIPGLKADIRYQWQKMTISTINIQSINTFSTRDLINRFTNIGGSGLPNYPYPLGGVYDRSGTDQKAWSTRGQLNFDRHFGVHNISAILGVETTESNSGSWTASTQYGYNPQTSVFGVPQQGTWITRPAKRNNIITVSPGSISGNLNRFGSSYGNLGYTFKEKYILTASARVDQSNFFGVKANDRKVPLWSVGLGWNISKEQFYKLEWLPTLRIRATYGYNGNVNAGTSPLATIGYATPIAPTFLPFARISTPPNPQLRWERVRNANLGLDFGSKNQRITGSIEFFKKNGIDLLSDIEIDPTSGFTIYTGNQSSIQTRGLDFSITCRNIHGIFKWYTTAIFSYQQNKVTAYSVAPPTQGALGSSTLIGKPQGSLYAYRWAGLNPLNGTSQFYLKDQVLDATQANQNKVRQEDLIYIGQSNPPTFGALRNDLNFENIQLSFNISYQFGHYFRRQSFNGTASGWIHRDYLQAWKVSGDEKITNVPAFLEAYPDNRYNVYSNSDIMIEKGDFIRLQDIRLSYNINRSVINKLPFTNASFYFYLNNVGVLWKASKYNLDTQGGLSSPRTKTFSFGLNVNF